MRVFLDIETTGLYAGSDEVVQIGVVAESGKVLMNQLVRSVKAASWRDAQNIHGISIAVSKTAGCAVTLGL